MKTKLILASLLGFFLLLHFKTQVFGQEKTKSILDQQKEHADSMRQRDKNLANEVFGKNRNLPYDNPNGYLTTPPPEKGEWYVEYTINGKKVTLYKGNEKFFSRSVDRRLNQVICHIMVPKPYKLFELTITDPANFPDIRKFEFGKTPTTSKKVMSGISDPVVNENADVNFHISLNITDITKDDNYRVMGTTGNKHKLDNVESGYFEILYYDSKNNGILEANFAFTVKAASSSSFGKPADLVITNGKLRIKLNNRD